MRSSDYYLNLVEEFHQAFHYCQPTPTEPILTDTERNTLRLSLLREEREETSAAIKVGDRIGILDGLCDYQYVLSGAILALGMRDLSKATLSADSYAKSSFSKASFWAIFAAKTRL